ncbi:hypothetical protein QQ045_013461 [Rhodiola kirilowii]
MASSTTTCSHFKLSLVAVFVLFATLTPSQAKKRPAEKLNVIDKCWRLDLNWVNNRERLTTCSVGFAGKMVNNVGKGLVHYVVTDPSDDPVNPRPGTLRYGATVINSKVWITFQQDMRIKLKQPLLVSSFTTIDGRGSSIHIAEGSCLLLYKVTNVIIHSIRIHHCRPRPGGAVIAPGSQKMQLSATDGDAIRLVGSSKIWIDHNTFYQCTDGLLDVTRGSTDITISNNWFRNHDKVMLLGHDDGFLRDKNMKVTVIFNHFGPDLNQRMPRVRHGYAHVANNLYKGWRDYAIGGSMNPSIMSESNLFIAPNSGNKKITWRQDKEITGRSWSFHSVNDIFINGAYASQSTSNEVRLPHYTKGQNFRVTNARYVRALTRMSGALRCNERRRC